MAEFKYEQLKKLPVYKVAHKMYYNKYPFCVRFKAEQKPNHYYFRNFDLETNVKSFLVNKDAVYRSRYDLSLAIFLLDIKAVDQLYQKFKNHIVSIEAPMNETQHDKMVEDLNITVRKKLFFKEYRYKIKFCFWRSTSGPDTAFEVIETCRTSFEKDNYRFSYAFERLVSHMESELSHKLHKLTSFWGDGTIYFKNYDDICTMHFLFKDSISKTTKIILEDELK
jgi:hypothetical protein